MAKTAKISTTAGNINTNPARSGKVITPSNTADLDIEARALKIGNTAGNLVVLMADEPLDTNTVTIPVQAGDFLPIQVRRVLASSTASTIVAFW